MRNWLEEDDVKIDEGCDMIMASFSLRHFSKFISASLIECS
jgi:hypothetical protein